MNNSFLPPVPNGRAELLEAFGAPIKLPTDVKLTVVTLPQLIGNVEHVHVGDKLQNVFADVFAAIWNGGYWYMFENCMGAWIYRDKRTVNALSLHSWGIAIDFNTISNPQGFVPPAAFDPAKPYAFATDHPIVQIFRNAGFLWGGDFEKEKDAMHFQYATGC